MQIQTDYLIVGAGAMGMAFADTLLTETDSHLTIVDRYHRAGGHWTMAYPFVRLHQPSAFYGVNSKVLGNDIIDKVGWNKGLYELATCDEVVAYFTHVMEQRFLPSGRVSYFPLCDYQGNEHFRSILTGEEFEVGVRRRIVDSTYMHVTVPSMRPPLYDVAEGVDCVPPNDLVKLQKTYNHYTVVGSGKTGIDACLWLLANGVAPFQIKWIMPRDAWLTDRAWVQPGEQFRQFALDQRAARGAAVMAATSVDDLFDRLAACGEIFRLSDDIRPTSFRCASVSRAELEQLLKVKDIVRLGRVQRLDEKTILLDRGSAPAHPGSLYVDCTADGLERRPLVPVFNGRQITLQSVRMCQQVFSAAFISHVEAAYTDDAVKNEICTPVQHPNEAIDWLHVIRATLLNALRWNADAGLVEWLRKSRLDWGTRFNPPMPSDPAERAAVERKVRETIEAQIAKLDQLMEQQSSEEGIAASAG